MAFNPVNWETFNMGQYIPSLQEYLTVPMAYKEEYDKKEEEQNKRREAAATMLSFLDNDKDKYAFDENGHRLDGTENRELKYSDSYQRMLDLTDEIRKASEDMYYNGYNSDVRNEMNTLRARAAEEIPVLQEAYKKRQEIEKELRALRAQKPGLYDNFDQKSIIDAIVKNPTFAPNMIDSDAAVEFLSKSISNIQREYNTSFNALGDEILAPKRDENGNIVHDASGNVIMESVGRWWHQREKSGASLADTLLATQYLQDAIKNGTLDINNPQNKWVRGFLSAVQGVWNGPLLRDLTRENFNNYDEIVSQIASQMGATSPYMIGQWHDNYMHTQDPGVGSHRGGGSDDENTNNYVPSYKTGEDVQRDVRNNDEYYDDSGLFGGKHTNIGEDKHSYTKEQISETADYVNREDYATNNDVINGSSVYRMSKGENEKVQKFNTTNSLIQQQGGWRRDADGFVDTNNKTNIQYAQAFVQNFNDLVPIGSGNNKKIDMYSCYNIVDTYDTAKKIISDKKKDIFKLYNQIVDSKSVNLNINDLSNETQLLLDGIGEKIAPFSFNIKKYYKALYHETLTNMGQTDIDSAQEFANKYACTKTLELLSNIANDSNSLLSYSCLVSKNILPQGTGDVLQYDPTQSLLLNKIKGAYDTISDDGFNGISNEDKKKLIRDEANWANKITITPVQIAIIKSADTQNIKTQFSSLKNGSTGYIYKVENNQIKEYDPDNNNLVDRFLGALRVTNKLNDTKSKKEYLDKLIDDFSSSFGVADNGMAVVKDEDGNNVYLCFDSNHKKFCENIQTLKSNSLSFGKDKSNDYGKNCQNVGLTREDKENGIYSKLRINCGDVDFIIEKGIKNKSFVNTIYMDNRNGQSIELAEIDESKLDTSNAFKLFADISLEYISDAFKNVFSAVNSDKFKRRYIENR